MRLLTFLITLLFCSIGAIGQPYQSLFGDTSTVWIQEVITMIPENPPLAIDIRFHKDTIVNGLDYKKVGVPGFIYNQFLLREDTNTGKVWRKSIIPRFPSDTFETLLVNMGLAKGDTFTMLRSAGFYSPPIEECIVDSVYYVRGRKHIRFIAQFGNYGHYEFIEGVGSNVGIIPDQNASYVSRYLLCSYKDEIQVYANTFYSGNCNPPLSLSNTITKKGYLLYPNPANEQLTITLSETAQQINAAILNLQGRLLIKQEKVSSDKFDIDLSSLPPGTYIIRLNTGSNVYYDKFIKL